MISDPDHRKHVGFGPGSWNAQLRHRLAAVRPNALPVRQNLYFVRLRPGSLESAGEMLPSAGGVVHQPWAQKSRSSTTSPSAPKRSTDTPARSSVPPSVSLVCALQGTAA